MSHPLRIAILCLAAAAASPAFAQNAPSTQPGAFLNGNLNATASLAPPNPTLTQFSDATASLYNQISTSLVRIRLDQSPASLLPPALLREFQDWRRSQPSTDDQSAAASDAQANPGSGAPPAGGRRGGGGGMGQGFAGRGDRGDRGGGRRGFGGPSADPNALPTDPDAANARPGQGNAALVNRFIEQKVAALADKDPDQAANLRGLLFRIAAIRSGITGDLYGVVIDDKGTTVVLTGLLREAQQDALRVTAPDGSEITAKFIGAFPSRGYSIIQLDKPGLAHAAVIASGRPASGALLMSIVASDGAAGWVVAPAKLGKRPVDERMPLFAGDDRGGAFVFDTQGRLAALAWGRFALPMDDLRQDIQWIVDNHRDIQPRQLGVRYSLVPAGVGPAGRGRDAARVDAVAPGSLAEKAGLKKGDIVVSIDRRPINQLPQIQMDLATRSGMVPLGIQRDGKDLTLEMPLENK